MYEAATYGGNFDKTLHLPSIVSQPASFVWGFPDYQGNIKTNKRINMTEEGNLKGRVTL